MRRTIVPGNSGSLWKAVRVANDINVSTLPSSLYLNNMEVIKSDQPDAFAHHFDDKIKKIVNNVGIDNNVYNGRKKVNAENKFFMSRDEVCSCMLSLKSKNSEGFDRIPQRILLDGAEVLTDPLAKLFEKIYY